MQFIDKLITPGEHLLTLQGQFGTLEAVLTVPVQISSNYVAFLGHPHSLQGGTMANKVVTTMARAFKELNIPSLRFNFRGVGKSQGVYDDGIGESKDMIGLARQWQEEQPNRQFIFAGFSFGSYVAYRAASAFVDQQALLITIAPPVHHYKYTEFQPEPKSWLIIQGNEDEVVPATEVVRFAHESQSVLTIIEFADTGHFFHGKLIKLKEALLLYLRSKVGLS